MNRLLLILLMLLPAPVFAAGYTARACGFDLDFNGVVGEAADCNVCDGTTTDVDGNSTEDDVWYVDCDGGTDTGSCPDTAPCATPQYALDNIGAPAASQIQAICIKGTCSSSSDRDMDIPHSGASGEYTRTKSGNEGWDFDYPRYPLMIVGWDEDDDGSYPPFDTDDTAAFDGDVTTNAAPWIGNTSNYNNIEIAHFRVQDYNKGCGSQVVTPQANNSVDGTDYFYMHDVDMSDNQQGCDFNDSTVLISGWGINDSYYQAYENNDFSDVDGFFIWRGNPSGQIAGEPAQYFRWRNNTVDGNTSSTSIYGINKIWNDLSFVEFLDNHIEDTITTGIVVGQCNQDFVIRGNVIKDTKDGIYMQPSEGSTCNSPARPIDNIIIDQNQIICPNPADYCDGAFRSGMLIGNVDNGGTSDEYVQDLTITNNFIWVESGSSMSRGMLIDSEWSGSGSTGGEITIVGNTFDGNFTIGAIVIEDFIGSSDSRVTSQWVVKNNLFTNLSTVDSTSPTQSNWSSANNRWQTSDTTDQVTGSACGSGPTYVSQSTGNLRLQSGDTCAKDVATDPDTGSLFDLCTECVDRDIDGTSRPVNTSWDAGGHEYTAGGGDVTVTGVTMTGVTVQ